ncbi:hypothetical protein IIB50_01085 [Patescibacteria group bacterium]|nr:hypothetical protein [Patescibacteria group bacterium]
MGYTVATLENNEIGKMLIYVDDALKKNANLKEKAFDFLHKDDETEKSYLFFQSRHQELLIRVLTLIMHTHGIEKNFAAEEKMRISIEVLKKGFGRDRKLH